MRGVRVDETQGFLGGVSIDDTWTLFNFSGAVTVLSFYFGVGSDDFRQSPFEGHHIDVHLLK